jgi:hypothetical protein
MGRTKTTQRGKVAPTEPEAPPPEPEAPPPGPEAPPSKGRKRAVAGEGHPKKKAKGLRAKSAYQFFSDEHRKVLESGLSMGEISKRCSAAWGNVADKSTYEASADADRARVESERAASAPAKKPTAYSLFLKAEHAKLKEAEPTLDFSARAKRCCGAWNGLSAADKAAWKPEEASA